MKIGLIGSGRMGQAVAEATLGTSHSINKKFDVDSPLTVPAAGECDILIDFSSAPAMDNNIRCALAAGIPLVTGTTGWYGKIEYYKKAVKDADGSLLFASNFSIGVLLVHKLMANAAALYGPFSAYDFAIHEVHHNQKADSPSGTALTIANEVITHLPHKKELQIGNAQGEIEADKLHVTSSRVGRVAGIHTLNIESEADSIEITHRANGRKGFASGAIRAAEWLIHKKGFYNISDMIDELLK